MSRTTKSTLALARTAMKVRGRALANYSHPNSPKKFTQPQLFAILAIKQFLKTDYRGTGNVGKFRHTWACSSVCRVQR